jgi:hypothetical protein
MLQYLTLSHLTDGKREPARSAARTAHGDQDGLFLFLVEVGAVEHIHRLLRKQFMQRQAAGVDLGILRCRRR